MTHWLFRLKVVILMILIWLIILGQFLTSGWSGDQNAYRNISIVQFEGGMRAWARSGGQLVYEQK